MTWSPNPHSAEEIVSDPLFEYPNLSRYVEQRVLGYLGSKNIELDLLTRGNPADESVLSRMFMEVAEIAAEAATAEGAWRDIPLEPRHESGNGRD